MFDEIVLILSIAAYIKLAILFFMQNVVFTTVSRARNRDKMWWGYIASLGSNGIWVFVIRELIKNFDDPIVIAMYIFMTAAGSTFGMWLNMKIEKLIGAKT